MQQTTTTVIHKPESVPVVNKRQMVLNTFWKLVSQKVRGGEERWKQWENNEHLIQVGAGCKGAKGTSRRNEVRHVDAHELQVLHFRSHMWAAFLCSGKRGKRAVTTLKSSGLQQFHYTHTDAFSTARAAWRAVQRACAHHLTLTDLSKSSMGVATSHYHHISVCSSVTEKSKEHTNTKSDYK